MMVIVVYHLTTMTPNSHENINGNFMFKFHECLQVRTSILKYMINYSRVKPLYIKFISSYKTIFFDISMYLINYFYVFHQ